MTEEGVAVSDAETPWALPALELWDGSDWPRYEEHLYGIFHADFLVTPPLWRGQPVTVQREPMLNGKAEGFWHIVTETGPSRQRDDRIPDPRRCERIRWVRAVLTAPEQEVRTFGEMRGSYQHVGIALPDFSYVVFIRLWPRNVQLKAAYTVPAAHNRASLERQWKLEKR